MLAKCQNKIDAGEKKYYSGDYKGALVDLNAAVAFAPHNASALGWRGEIKRMLGDHRGALEDLDSSVAYSPEDSHGLKFRGVTKIALGDYHGAVSDLQASLILRPGDTWIKDNLDLALKRIKPKKVDGKAKKVDGKTKKVVAGAGSHSEAASLKLDRAEAYHKSGYSKQSLGQYVEAIADFDQALRLKSDYHLAYHNRGYCKQSLGQYREAIADFDQAIRLKPDDASLYYSRGYNKSQLNEYEAAIKDYKTAIAKKDGYYPDVKACLTMAEEKMREQELLKHARAEAEAKARREQALLEHTRAEAEVKARHEAATREKAEGEVRGLAAQLSSLAIASKSIKSPSDLSALNAKFRELEPQAFKLRNVDFYVTRGSFYDEAGSKETGSTRKEALYNNALNDYQQAMKMDPFLDRVPDRIDALQRELLEIQRAKMTPAVVFSPVVGGGAGVGASRGGSSDSALTAVERAKIEEIKARMRAGAPGPGWS